MVVPTGELENSMMTMMTISITQKMVRRRRLLRIWETASRSRRRRSANTPPGEPERRTREAVSSSLQLKRILPLWKPKEPKSAKRMEAKSWPKLKSFNQRLSSLSLKRSSN